VPAALGVNLLAAAVSRTRARGSPLIDLTVSNPTVVGLPYPPSLVEALGDPRGLVYRPSPLGLHEARAAVAAEYDRHGAHVDARQVVLAASTSEAYGYLFKLFCDPGDEVLVPAPSYPLFEHLAWLDAVTVRPYPLEYHGTWAIDIAALDAACSTRTRLVLAVAPNNPTGSFLRRRDWDDLRRVCLSRGLPIACDEVFLDYPLEPADDAVRGVSAAADGEDGPLVLALGGLSKSVGLPQHKLGWIVLHGPANQVAAVEPPLELIADTYLSVSTPVQVAAPRLLREGTAVRAAIRARLARNLQALRARVAASPACDVLRVEGGWSAVLRVPATRTEESLALELVERDGVLTHPGFFFDFPAEAYVIVSLLPEPAAFDDGVDRVCRRAEG
jgi:aspartate/methionine/tyrosine aminotransferase